MSQNLKIQDRRKLLLYGLLLVSFLIPSCKFNGASPPIPNPSGIIPATPAAEQYSSIPATSTADMLVLTPIPVFEPPVGFIEYQESAIGVSIYIPDSWTVTGVIEGQYLYFLPIPKISMLVVESANRATQNAT